MSYQTLLTEARDGVGVVTVNRPEVRNALNRRVMEELRAVLDGFREDDGVGAVVVTGAAEKAFVAGADIGELRERTMLDGLAASMQRLYDEVEGFEKPTIAAVNGYALGGGCELAMACDIRIAAENARFGLPETALSIIPGAGGTQRLARLVGKGRAIEMILSKGPLAVRLAKLAVQTGFETDQHTGLVVERLAQTVLYASEDKREGTSAFLEKREPRFKGR
jgi:enoyl-CoA hydratase/carnithine racemase